MLGAFLLGFLIGTVVGTVAASIAWFRRLKRQHDVLESKYSKQLADVTKRMASAGGN